MKAKKRRTVQLDPKGFKAAAKAMRDIFGWSDESGADWEKETRQVLKAYFKSRP